MLKFSAYDLSFAAMLRKCAPSFWLVVHKCLHPNGNERCRVVIVQPVDMRVRGYIWVYIELSEDQ